MKLIITGGAGYVGSHVCKQLRIQHIQHIAYDNLSTGHAHALPGTQLITGDITDAAALDACFAEHRPDGVIHLAALATIPDCNRDPRRTEAVNVEGTRLLLEAMRKHKARFMVMASSCGVYAATPTPRPFTEKDPLDPPSLYGKSKLAGEKWLAQYYERYGIGSIALRIFNVAGADSSGEIGEDHTDETHLVPLAIRAALKGTPLQLFGSDYPTQDGTAVRDYIHVLDVAGAALAAAGYLSNHNTLHVLNCGSGTPTSVLGILRAVEVQSGKKVPYALSPRREGDAPYLLGDISELKRILGYMPAHSSVETIIGSALAWHEKNG